MTIFLVFPFTRLVHIWSAPIWYLGRTGYQVVRTKQPVESRHRDQSLSDGRSRRKTPAGRSGGRGQFHSLPRGNEP